MTFKELTEYEPELGRLLKFAKCVRDDGQTNYFCSNEIWYRLFKPQLSTLVGWECSDPRLAGEDVYDIAYQTIYDVLPPCRDCGCM